jgi:endoglucanase
MQMIRLIFFSVFWLLSAGLAAAETIVLKRGLALDTWITWPGDDRFSEPAIITGFPEWRAVVTDGELRSIREAGFDFVRMPIDPAIFLWPGNLDKRNTLIAGLKEALRRVKAAGLKVVVDVHALPVSRPWKSIGTESYLESGDSFANYLELVAVIATALAKEDPSRVALEPMNEPTADCEHPSSGARQKWPAMLDRLHQTARQAAPNLSLILSGACWGSAAGLARLNPATIEDENIIWSFHSYEPFIYTHQGASWTGGPESHVVGLTYPPTRKQRRALLQTATASIAKAEVSKARKAQLHKELRYNLDHYFADSRKDMRQAFARVAKWAARHGIPSGRILLGEFGAHRLQSPQGDDSTRARYLRDVRQQAEKAGYGWSVWSWSGSFGIARTEKGRDITPEILSSLGLNTPAP